MTSFYRAFNAVFDGRIRRNGSVEVIIQSVRSKTLPCLLYAIEACPVNESNINSLDFSFQTKSTDVIKECRWLT